MIKSGNIRPATPSRSSRNNSPADDPVSVAIERQAFFTAGIAQMKMLSAGMGALALVSVLLTYLAVTNKTEPVYFVAYEDGRLVNMVPLSQPNYSQSAISQWLTNALVDTFDFHFGNVEQELNEAASLWFTSAGADALMQTWEDSGNYRAIIERKLFLSLVVTHTPVLLQHGLPPGSSSYVWRFQAPAVLTFRTESRVFTNNVTFTVDVSRRSVLESPNGLGISKIVMGIQP